MRSLIRKMGILGTSTLAATALLIGIYGPRIIRGEFPNPVVPEMAYEQTYEAPRYVSGYTGDQILEDRLIPEEDLVVDYIAKNYPKAAALDILDDPKANIQAVQSAQDLRDLGIYSAHTDSLLDAHDSLYHIQGNSLVGIDFTYLDNTTGFLEKVDYKTYFGVTKTDTLKHSE